MGCVALCIRDVVVVATQAEASQCGQVGTVPFYVKARVVGVSGDDRRVLTLDFPGMARGSLEVEVRVLGFAFRSLELEWSGKVEKLKALLFGGVDGKRTKGRSRGRL